MLHKFMRVMLCGMLILGLTSCARLRFWDWGKKSSTENATMATDGSTVEDYEAALRSLVERHIESATRNADSQKGRIVKRKPYFFKEYANYPQGAQNMEVVLQETESRTRPYLADVQVRKIRFSTRLHRKRDEARSDNTFIRDTGQETLTYEYRNGRWVRIGSLFVAEKSEVQVDGVWVARPEDEVRTVAAEEHQSWFSKIWSKFTGGE